MKTPLGLSPRREGSRDKREIQSHVVSFSLEEIKQHFDENLAVIKKQSALADELARKDTNKAKVIWRAQIVFLESSLDFYLHEITKHGVVQIFNQNWAKSKAYSQILLPIQCIEEAMNNPETSDWLLDAINEKFCHGVFLDKKMIKAQCTLLNIDFKAVSNEAKVSEERLQEIFLRRNQIAHQSDRRHGDAVLEDISSAYVNKAIADVCSFVGALHKACQERETGFNLSKGPLW